MSTAQDAAGGFARKLRAQDLAQVVDFDTRVEILQGFTSDAAALETAIRGTTAGGSTSLYNALYISLKELVKVQPKSDDDVRRRAVGPEIRDVTALLLPLLQHRRIAEGEATVTARVDLARR